MLINIFLLIIGFAMLISGANFLLNGSIAIARKYKISEIIIGLTIVAFGTSAPEFAVSVISAIKGKGEIVVGDIVGSNILNIGLILGITGLFATIKSNKQILRYDLPFCIFISVLFPFLVINSYFSRIEGILYMFLFMLILILWYRKRHSIMEEEIEKVKETTFFKSFLWIIIGTIGLGVGGEVTVRGAVKIAKFFDVSETIIAISIVAVGTSLPEIVTSLTAVIRKRMELSLGNIVGSNIFNLLLCMGTSALIKPFHFSFSKNFFTIIVNIYFAFLLFVILKFFHKISFLTGVILLLSYIVYLIILF